MIALIPMAGAGSRFAENGYSTPKPLLPILGKPMVISAAESLPDSGHYIFIVRDFQVKEYDIVSRLKQYFPNCEVVVLDHLTDGQARTCLMAKDLIRPDEALVIGASDNGMIYDRKEFEIASGNADALVFTFRNNPAVLSKPQAYGWVRTEPDGNAVQVSVKIPISETPMQDHAVVGTFWFGKGNMFIQAAERMIQRDGRINNEFYVDECINDLIALGYRVKVFEIKHYVCWGTPADYETFLYWERFYDKYLL